MITENAAQLTEDAVRLVMFGLKPKVTPGSDLDYGELMGRFLSSSEFREHVEAAIRGHELHLQTANRRLGLVLTADPDSPFAPKMYDYSTSVAQNYETRVAHGILHMLLALYTYPSREHLRDDDELLSHRINAKDFVEWAIDACTGLQGAEDLAQASQPHRDGVRHILDQSPSKLERWADGMLIRYTQWGLLLEERTGDKKTYRGRSRFKLQVRFLMKESELHLAKILEDNPPIQKHIERLSR